MGDRFGKSQVNPACGGKGESPAIDISGIPPKTKSLAVTIFDPDAPTESGWWHWLVFDLPPTTTSIAENASAHGLPRGAEQGRNDFGDIGYGGPCPPSGTHHYHVIVWALSVSRLKLPPHATSTLIDAFLENYEIAESTQVIKYSS